MKGKTILIRHITRERLKKAGRKDQTYDDLINELIDLKKRHNPVESNLDSPSQKIGGNLH